MLPVLKANDIVRYQSITFDKCNINDLVLIKKNSQTFTHRIIYKIGSYLISKGDNNYESDGRIHPQKVIAKAVAIKRGGNIININDYYLFQSTLYFQEILIIKKAFEKIKIDFVFLKGLPLHLYYEKSYPKRFYADCDVLINRSDIIAAEKILKKQGYKKFDQLLSQKIKRKQGEEIEITYFKYINNHYVIFDIHFEVDITIVHINRINALYPQKFIDQLTEEFLKSRGFITIEHNSFPILSKERLIIYLALHFFHHNFHGIFRLEFIHKIICAEKEIKYNVIIDRIKQYRLKNFVYPVFILLKKYYQTPIPKMFYASIAPKDSQIQKYINNLTKIDIFSDETRVQAGVNRFKNLFFLSPSPFWKKLLVFLNPQVFYSIFWVFKRRLLK